MISYNYSKIFIPFEAVHWYSWELKNKLKKKEMKMRLNNLETCFLLSIFKIFIMAYIEKRTDIKKYMVC